MELSRILPATLLALALGAAAHAGQKPRSAAKPTPTPAATPKAEEPPIFDPEADGYLVLKHYREVCEKSNKRLLVFFGTNDSRTCRVVNQAIFERRFYSELIKQFVPAFIDVTPGTANSGLPEQYGIDPMAPLPGVVLFDPKHTVLEVLKKGEMAEIAKKGKDEVQLWVLARFYRSKPD